MPLQLPDRRILLTLIGALLCSVLWHLDRAFFLLERHQGNFINTGGSFLKEKNTKESDHSPAKMVVLQAATGNSGDGDRTAAAPSSPRDVLERACCAPKVHLNGRFVAESWELFRFVLNKIEHKRPVAWFGWGGGRFLGLSRAALLFLSGHDRSFVNVGMHWLRQWHRARGQSSSSSSLSPVIRDVGIRGWPVSKDRAHYTVTVLVGPSHLRGLRGLPFVNETIFISAKGAEHHTARTDAIVQQCVDILQQYAPQPLFFVLVEGRSTKMVIADLLNRTTDDRRE